MQTVAYVYKWTHIPTGKWYIGSRTRVGAHPADGYYCSSKLVKPLIIANPHEWQRDIIATGDPISMRDLETKLLQDANAKHDNESFNQHNNDRSPVRTGIPHSLDSIEKMKGPRNQYGPQSAEHIEKRAAKKRGVARPDLVASNRSRTGEKNPNFGKSQSDEWKLRNSLANQKPKNKVNCPHCDAIGGEGIMKRWHFDHCKLKKESK